MLFVIAVNGQMQQNFILVMQWIMLSNAGQEIFDILHSFLFHAVASDEYQHACGVLWLLINICNYVTPSDIVYQHVNWCKMYDLCLSSIWLYSSFSLSLPHSILFSLSSHTHTHARLQSD